MRAWSNGIVSDSEGQPRQGNHTWEGTADPRDERIAILVTRVAELEGLLAAARKRNDELERENRELRARLGQNSTNSSKPPSSDPPGTRRVSKTPPTGRRPGGQPGHKKHERELVPPEQVNRFVDVVPPACEACGQRLQGMDTAPIRHQVIDIPPIKPEITEYRCHELKCDGCGATTRAPLPEEVKSLVGDRLGALICLMMGQYRLSKRMVQMLLSDLLGVELSLGMVPKVGTEMSEALAPAVEEAAAFVQKQDAVNADETGWFEGKSEGKNGRAWLWVFATQLVIVFCISHSRGSQVAKAVLGEDFTGFLTSDRWSAYNWHDIGLRQLCWSHLTRDFQSFIERGGEAGRIGEALMRERDRMFEWWHRVRDGTMSQEEFEHRMKKVERKIGRLLRKAAVCPDDKVAGTAQEMLKLEPAMWTFVQVPGLEPTNNFGERCIRHAVMWRKTSFGTQSPEGSRFVERILTVVATLKLQERNTLEFLTQSLAAHRRGQRGPSLLPSMPAKSLALAA